MCRCADSHKKFNLVCQKRFYNYLKSMVGSWILFTFVKEQIVYNQTVILFQLTRIAIQTRRGASINV